MDMNNFGSSPKNKDFDETMGYIFKGPLILGRDPVLPNELVTKNYMDNKMKNVSTNTIVSGLLPVNTLPKWEGDLSNYKGTNTFILSETGVSDGNYTRVRVDAKGRVLEGLGLTAQAMSKVPWTRVRGNGKGDSAKAYGIKELLTFSGGEVGPNFQVRQNSVDLELFNKQYVTANSGGSSSGNDYPVGSILEKSSSPGSAYLLCNGAMLNKADYPALFNVIGTKFGSLSIPIVGSEAPLEQFGLPDIADNGGLKRYIKIR